MICPVCKHVMVDIEYHRIELDYCTNCRGVWFDAQELELLLCGMGCDDHGLPLSNIEQASEARTMEKGRRCPICNLKMRKIVLGETKVLIDACPQGDGLWFDGGEVSHLLKQVTKRPSEKGSAEQQVMDFLGEVFQAQE